VESSLLAAENLTAGYQEKVVWRDANFAIGRGEFVAVIGPNGAGKTTLFRLLLGLQRPIAGTIKIFGEQPKRGNPRIGYVPQRHAIDSDTNIEAQELVRLGLSGKRWGFNARTMMLLTRLWGLLAGATWRTDHSAYCRGESYRGSSWPRRW